MGAERLHPVLFLFCVLVGHAVPLVSDSNMVGTPKTNRKKAPGKPETTSEKAPRVQKQRDNAEWMTTTKIQFNTILALEFLLYFHALAT